MVAQTWSDVLFQSLQNLWLGVIEFLPQLLLAIIIFIIGWLIAVAVEKLIMHLVDAVKLDSFLKNTGLSELMEKAGYSLNSGAFLGGLIKWFIIIVFLVASLDIVGLSEVNAILSEVVLVYLPNVIIAAIVLLIGSVVAHAVRGIVQGSTSAAGASHAKFFGATAHSAVWIFTILIALSQLGIAAQLIQILFIGFVAMIAIGGGLAFGLGGRDAAKGALEKIAHSIKK